MFLFQIIQIYLDIIQILDDIYTYLVCNQTRVTDRFLWVNFHQYCWALSIQLLQLSCIFFSDFYDYRFFPVLAFYAGTYVKCVGSPEYILQVLFISKLQCLQFMSLVQKDFLFLISVLLFQFFTISNLSFTMLIQVLIYNSCSHYSLFNNFTLFLLHKLMAVTLELYCSLESCGE